MTSLPYYTPGEHLTFLGFEMQQNRFAPLAWSEVILREEPDKIIEIGTWTGGFTCLLAMAAQQFDCQVSSYDNDSNEPWNVNGRWFSRLGIDQWRFDVLTKLGIDEIRHDLTRGKAFLLCDGGNKVKEFQTFAPFLKSGDIIAAHDYADSRTIKFWNTQEITPIDIEATVQQCGLERYEPDLMAEAGWLAYKKV